MNEEFARLKELAESYNTENNFKVGDAVKWKDGLKNRRRPRYKELLIVVKVLDDPIYEEERSSLSPYFREKLDIILGLIDDDDDFYTLYYDSNRLTPADD